MKIKYLQSLLIGNYETSAYLHHLVGRHADTYIEYTVAYPRGANPPSPQWAKGLPLWKAEIRAEMWGGGGDVCRNNDSHLFCLPIKVVVFPISAYLEIRFLTPGKNANGGWKHIWTWIYADSSSQSSKLIPLLQYNFHFKNEDIVLFCCCISVCTVQCFTKLFFRWNKSPNLKMAVCGRNFSSSLVLKYVK